MTDLDLDRLYDDHWSSVFHYLRGHIDGADHAVIEDLTADTFLRAIRKAHLYREGGKGPRSWLLTIAQRIMLDWFRRQRLRSTTDLEAVDFQRWRVDAGSEQHDDAIDVRTAVAALPERDRLVIRTSFWEGRTWEEIGQALGCRTSKPVWTAFRRSRPILREALEPTA